MSAGPAGPLARDESLGGIDTLVRRLIFSLVALVLVTGGAGIVSVIVVERSLHQVADDLVPVLDANSAIQQDVVDADSAIRGWVVSGDELALQPYRTALARLETHEAELRAAVAGNERLEEIARRQELAVADWVSTYATERITHRPGVANLDAAFEALGWGKHERIRSLNRQLSQATREELDVLMQGSAGALPWIFAAMIVVAVLGAFALAVGRRMATHISSPLERLEQVVGRWAAGDPDARAVPAGPREVRNVARALNTFADDNARAREVQRRMVVELTSADRAKSKFVSNVSHELRTPLTSIAGYLELLDDELTPQQRAMMSVVNRNVVRLRGLIEDLLTLSAAESDPSSRSVTDVDLETLASEVAFDLRAVASARGLTITVEQRRRGVVVQGDRNQLARALLNLVSNAVKFSADEAVVVIVVDQNDAGAVVEVVDHGLGIPADALPALGTRFYRAPNAVSAEVRGTGLGLHIVRAILDNHGGRLEFESEEGVGTTARILLPLAPPDHESLTAEQPEPRELTARGGSARGRA